jgi:putative endonuclease
VETNPANSPAEELPPPGQHCVYALLCDDGSLYIGLTADLKRRFREHQAGRAARWTKKHKPLRIVYFEVVDSHYEATKLERAWKKSGRQRLKRMAAAQQVGDV